MAMHGAIKQSELLKLAARIFGEPLESLSLDTRYGEVPGWDSVNHLRMVMEAESLFGVNYALETIPQMRRLQDFVDRADGDATAD